MAIPQKDTNNLPARACKFCHWCHGSGKARECRYNPPRVGGFPRVQPNDFCSKYSANDVLIDAEIERRAKEAQKALDIEKALKRVP